VPLAELLPEVLRRAGEAGGPLDVPAHASGAGWVLRRGDGTLLRGDAPLAQQSVRDGDVLYLVPRHLTWPEPAYDDVIEEIAATARTHGRSWDASATRAFALVAAGLVLLTGLGTLLAVGPPRLVPAIAAGGVAGTLLAVGVLLSRALGDGVAGAAAGGMALPYATAAGALFGVGDTSTIAPSALLVGACALLLASALGAAAIGFGLRVFVAGATLGLAGLAGAVLGLNMSAPRAASIVVVLLVGGIGLAPMLAVRFGRLPLPVVSASPQVLANETRPARPELLAAVVRGDEILHGCLAGIAVAAAGCAAVLTAAGGVAAPLLGGVASVALLLRARLFPSIASRLPLLVSGLVGLALAASAVAAASGSATRLLGATLAFAAVVALLATAATAPRRRAGASPYLRRLGDVLDVASVLALAPAACVVIGLFGWVRALAS
jgi:type VII secretion integral membrane protein EccD